MSRRSFAIASVVAILCAAPALADDNDNTSNIDQIGSNLTATATQGGAGNTNLSNIDQGLGSPADNLSATVDQGGINNILSEAHIIQDGADNIGTINQGGDTTSNYAYIEQSGANNEADILQNGTLNTNGVEIYQTGTGAMNMVSVEQGGMGNSNTAGVSQSGSGLTATIVQN